LRIKRFRVGFSARLKQFSICGRAKILFALAPIFVRPKKAKTEKLATETALGARTRTNKEQTEVSRLIVIVQLKVDLRKIVVGDIDRRSKDLTGS